MRLEQLLFTQGFGTRHECRGLIAQGRVAFDGVLVSDPDGEVQPEGKVFCVDGTVWPYVEKAVLALNKPTGFECSAKPLHHPSVLTLLPPFLRKRGVQPVGRLDEDTTGLLLLTDDGALIHRWTHPKRAVEKTYCVTLKHEATEALTQKLLEGVLLVDEKEVVKAKSCTLTSATQMKLTITSGKYHQVKRMVAAAGNRVEALHREKFGQYELPKTLAEGHWQWISASDVG